MRLGKNKEGDLLGNFMSSIGKQTFMFKLINKLQTRNFGIFVGLIVLSLIFGITTENFFSTNNLLTIALQTSIIAIVAIGQTFVIIKAGIDLSVGSMVAISGVIA